MSLRTKQFIIAALSALFLLSLIFVQAMEVWRKGQETGMIATHVSAPAESRDCITCHQQSKNSPGIVDHWEGSTHAEKGVACYDCHQAREEDPDSYLHYGMTIATIVTPLDCRRCHEKEYNEFTNSHHAKAGNILASLDNFLAEKVEGNREPFNPHSPTPGRNDFDLVNGMASVNTGCKQCHGARVALEGTDGSLITDLQLQPDPETGVPTNQAAVALIKRDPTSDKPILHASGWPNTGIGRKNLDGSLGSCSACHSRHDFSPRRARQPENCGKCHLGPDHPQKEIYEESKHGVAFRDLKDHMNLDAASWVLGEDYTQAPTCATCHMSANAIDRDVTHDPSLRLSWTNRPDISWVMDTDREGQVIKETNPAKRSQMLAKVPEDQLQPGERQPSSWQEKRQNMRNVCQHCHTPAYVDAFYTQYDEFINNYNEKFGKPGKAIMTALLENDLRTKTDFDEEIEWTWFYLWHHEGRRARHGASMMAPDYAHWHGMYEVAERFYMELIPQARELIHHAEETGQADAATAVEQVIEAILARPEHQWFEQETSKRQNATE
jgi:hypothetical protein